MPKILTNRYAQLVLTLVIGVAVGAIFYPSKSIRKEEIRKYEEKLAKQEKETATMQLELGGMLNEEKKQNKTLREESHKKISSLKEENFKLKSKITEKRFKIIKPDGTIEERWFKESETDVVASAVTNIKSEFTRKVTSIEKKWKKVHEERVKKIKSDYEKKLSESKKIDSSIEKKEKIDINKRNFGISLGKKTDNDYFSGISYDIFGPVFLDLHFEADEAFGDKEAGLGIGLRF